MNKVTFGDNEYNAIQIFALTDIVDGANRTCIDIHLPVADYSVDSLHQILSNPINLEKITTTGSTETFDGSVITQIFDNFAILVKIGIEGVNTQAYNPDGNPVFEERIVIRLAKRTTAEIQMKQMMDIMKKAGLM